MLVQGVSSGGVFRVISGENSGGGFSVISGESEKEFVVLLDYLDLVREKSSEI